MIVEYEGKSVRVPDFLIVGAAKAGTTSLHNYLKRHPDVFMFGPRKEPFFFTYMHSPPSFDGPIQDVILSEPEQYFASFEEASPECMLGECSNTYLYEYSRTIDNIKKVYGDSFGNLKIIIILRNPVERAFSMYEMLKNRGVEDLEFMDAVSQQTIRERLQKNYSPAYDYLGFGLYSKQVEAYLSTFPNCYVCLINDLKVSTPSLMENIFKFIGVNVCADIDYSIKHNISGQPKSAKFRKVSQWLGNKDWLRISLQRVIGRKNFDRLLYRIKYLNTARIPFNESYGDFLIPYFKSDIKKLERLIHRDLSNWLS